jgi:ankyrin repeat protein
MNIDEAIAAQDIARVRQLIEAGADLKKIGAYDSTPLANAAAIGNAELVTILLAADADPNNGGCRVPLGIAAGHGYSHVVKLLLQAGADPNARDMEGDTSLHMAAFSGSLETVRLLVEAGADPMIKGYLNLIAVEVAREQGHEEIVAYLKSIQS